MNEILIKSWYDPCQSDLELNDSYVCVSIYSTDISKVLIFYESFMESILVKNSKNEMIWKNLGRELISENQFDVWTNSIDDESSAKSFVAIICALTEKFKSNAIPDVTKTHEYNNGFINIPILKDEYKSADRFMNPILNLMKRDDVHKISFYDYNEGITTKYIEKGSDMILDLINKYKDNETYLGMREYILNNSDILDINTVSRYGYTS